MALAKDESILFYFLWQPKTFETTRIFQESRESHKISTTRFRFYGRPSHGHIRDGQLSFVGRRNSPYFVGRRDRQRALSPIPACQIVCIGTPEDNGERHSSADMLQQHHFLQTFLIVILKIICEDIQRNNSITAASFHTLFSPKQWRAIIGKICRPKNSDCRLIYCRKYPNNNGSLMVLHTRLPFYGSRKRTLSQCRQPRWTS